MDNTQDTTNWKERLCLALGLPIALTAVFSIPIYSYSPTLEPYKEFINQWLNFIIFGHIVLFLLGMFIFLMPILLFNSKMFKNKGE